MTAMILRDWPRPLRLLCCLLSTDGSELKRIIQAMTEHDWHCFVELATERHRVAPSVFGRLSELQPPKHISDMLVAANHANAMRVLEQLAVLKSIKENFDAAHVPMIVLKGLPLAEQLFGNSSARSARDIDVLVSSDDVASASDLLVSMGFHPEPETQALVGSHALIAEINNLSFTNPDTGVLIELHWRCHQFADWPEVFHDGDNLETVATSIGALKVPTQQGNLIYLSIHGSMHRWCRLKWLLDVATLAQDRGVTQLEEDLIVSRKLGAAKPVELGLYLSAAILGTPSPATRYDADSWLPAQCLGEISRPEAVPDGFAQRMKFYAMMFATANDFRQRMGIVRYRTWGKRRLSVAARQRAA